MNVFMWLVGLPFTVGSVERRKRWNSRLLVAGQTGKFWRQPSGMRYGSKAA
jgi:hypothetical protein